MEVLVLLDGSLDLPGGYALMEVRFSLLKEPFDLLEGG